jgi:hypothetical protein
MHRDPEAKRQGYTSNSYIWALEEGLQPFYPTGTFFLQDNAKMHTSKKSIEWLERHGIWVLGHPPP